MPYGYNSNNAKIRFSWDSPINYFTARGLVTPDITVQNLYTISDYVGVGLYISSGISERQYSGTDETVLTLTLEETEEYAGSEYYIIIKNINAEHLTRNVSVRCTRP